MKKYLLMLLLLLMPLNLTASTLIQERIFESSGMFLFADAYDGHRVDTVGASKSTTASLHIPDYAQKIVKIEVYFITGTGAATTGRDINFTANFSAENEVYNTHVASDTTSTYDLSACLDKICTINLTTLLSAALPGDTIGLTIAHGNTNGNIYYLNFVVYYKM